MTLEIQSPSGLLEYTGITDAGTVICRCCILLRSNARNRGDYKASVFDSVGKLIERGAVIGNAKFGVLLSCASVL